MTQPAYACATCGATSSAYALKCPACGKGVVRRVVVRQRPNLSLVQVAPSGLTYVDPNVKEPERISLGIDSFDRAFGLNSNGRGGFVRGSIVTTAGDPGAGKTTFGLVVAEAFLSAGASVIYAPSESSPTMFSLMSLRTGLAKRVPLLFTRSVTEILREAETVRPDLLVVDSLHSLDPRTDALPHARRLVDWVNSTGASLLIIGERSKSGSTRGDWGIEYQGDVTIGLEKLNLEKGAPDKPGEPTPPNDPLEHLRRWFIVTKNRHGGTGRYALLLTERGWTEMPDASP